MIESIESSAYLPYIQLAMVAVFFFACYRVEEKQIQSEQLNQESELNEVGHHEIIKSVPSSLSMEQPKKYISVSSEKQVIEGINNSFEWINDSRFRKTVK
jgi:hypothetical protein